MTPKLKTGEVRSVVRDEYHNAFTDLCTFGDHYYLTFRSCSEGHGISPEAFVRVLRSSDADRWEEVHRFSVPERDTRDPHFLVFKQTLFVYSGTWDASPEGRKRKELNDHVGYCVRSNDGTSWSNPEVMESTRGHYIWRAAAFGDYAYLCGKRKSGFVTLPTPEEEWAVRESAMLRSSDGIKWEDAAIFQDTYGDETAFVFDDNGVVTALVRGMGSTERSFICRSDPPYDEWERHVLDRKVGGPMLARWGNYLLAGGRRSFMDDDPTTVLYWLDGDRLIEAAELPSRGDNSYPGFVELSPEQGLLSYYSSHEGSGDPPYPASIYLVDLAIEH